MYFNEMIPLIFTKNIYFIYFYLEALKSPSKKWFH